MTLRLFGFEFSIRKSSKPCDLTQYVNWYVDTVNDAIRSDLFKTLDKSYSLLRGDTNVIRS
jgi:hypothetical protein